MDEARLDRIENKLDEVGQAIIALARMEERMITLFKRMDSFDTIQDAHGSRITTLEMSSGTNGQALRFAERIFWILATAGVAYLFARLKAGA